jgi:hypothetical protein
MLILPSDFRNSIVRGPTNLDLDSSDVQSMRVEHE